MVKWIKRKEKIKARSSDDIRSRILKARGVEEDLMIDFMSPDESWYIDHSLIRNLERTVKLIMQHVEEGNSILVSGDPDADGVTSLAIMYNRLKDFSETYGIDLDYIYAQRDMGHGIYGQITINPRWHNDEESQSFIDLVENNIEKVEEADLLIILDSSSNDIEGLKQCKELNPKLDIIILDHHNFDNLETEKEVGKLATVVNIQHSKDESPNKDLSGAGVVYKVCKGIDDYIDDQGYSNQFLDLVAIGLVGDMMDVMNMENRYLIMQGLTNVNNIGLTRILKGANINTWKYNTKDIGFTIAPLINSSARMNQIELAIDILLVETDKEAKPLRLKMNKLNEQRKASQKEIFDKYKGDIDLSQKIIIIVDEESNKGFNGLVAQNLSQQFHRPCFVVRDYNGMCMGSGRSYGSFNTKDFLSELDWVEASGHNQSHGLNFPTDKLEDLKEYIEENMPDDIEDDIVYYYDVEIDPENIWEDAEDIEPINMITGRGFPEVTVVAKDITIDERLVIGKTKETVKFTTDDDLVLIKFKVDEEWNKDIDVFDTVSVLGTVNINVFYNFGTKETTKTPQIQIQSIMKE